MQSRHAINALASSSKRTRARLAASVLTLLVAPSLAFGQDVNDVTLRFANGQDSISGTLTDFRDGKFFLDATIGLVAIPVDGVSCIGNACPEETRLEIENAGVVLTSKDGSASISGDLIEIVDGEYLLATAFGEQRIAVDRVDCKGEGCIAVPESPPADPSVELTNGEVTLQGNLLGFDDGIFILDDRVMGEIRVRASEFECRGAACP